MRQFGLIGYPLGHSFSVPYFTSKFSREKVDSEYKNYPLEDISQFESLVKDEPHLRGLNVTVPYKQSIIPYLDALSRTARTIKAVNTINFCRRDGRLALIGHNTDVHGFKRSLQEHLQKHHTKALVLGTGGSSRAVTYVLKELGIEYTPVSRNRGEDRVTYDDLREDTVAQCPLIINTTPLGMHPGVDGFPDIPYNGIRPGHLLFDLVYNPEKTRFLAMGEEKGAHIVNGYDMLVYQAESSWEFWNRE